MAYKIPVPSKLGAVEVHNDSTQPIPVTLAEGARPITGIVQDQNGVTITPKFATIVASASGDTAIVAAVLAKKIRVLSFTLVANAAVNVKLRRATTDITGLLYLAANGGVSVALNQLGHCETGTNEALNINLSGAVAVGGFLTYIEV
jgi:hypothetical protein